MKNQELKEDLNLLGIMRLDIKGCRSYDVDKLWNWINQNYISKEEILGLVDEQKIVGNINDCCIANLNELKKEIKKL